MGTELNCKKSLSVICKILRLFVNILSAIEKSSFPNREYLTPPTQMQLSQKQKTFSEFLFAFSTSRLNFEHFQKKDDPHSLFIFEGTACENMLRSMCKKSYFRLPFQKEHGKRVSTLLKSEGQHLYHIY